MYDTKVQKREKNFTSRVMFTTTLLTMSKPTNNRFKLYQSNLDNIKELDNNSCLRKILRGEENE